MDIDDCGQRYVRVAFMINDALYHSVEVPHVGSLYAKAIIAMALV
jgi:hypothetical protein